MNTRTKTCPSEYEIDEFWLAKRSSDHPLAAHLRECARCRSLLEEYSRAESEFERAVFPETINEIMRRAPRVSRRNQLIRFAAVVTPLAAAAMIGAIILFPGALSRNADPEPPGAYVGEKGNLGFEVYCRRGETVFLLREGDTIFEDDALRFSLQLSSPDPRYGMVVSVNEKGDIFPYFPLNGSKSVKLPSQGPLPGSVIMDQTQGHERLFFLVSDRQFALSEVTNAVKISRENSHKTLIPSHLPVDLEQMSIAFRKEKRP